MNEVNLPAVSVTAPGSRLTRSFPAGQVESVVSGPRGVVILRGGPAIRGTVREATATILGAMSPGPNPEDKTSAQIVRRNQVGSFLKEIARSSVFPDPFGEDSP